MAEKDVQIVKNIPTMTHSDKQDLYLALLRYRNILIIMSDNLGSPAQQLMGHKAKTLLSTFTMLLQLRMISTRTVKNSCTTRRKDRVLLCQTLEELIAED